MGKWEEFFAFRRMERYDVIIVGGGISGLVAARTLLQHDPEISVALLEGKPSLGGRIESLPVQVHYKSVDYINCSEVALDRCEK